MSTATIESAKMPRAEPAANLKPKEHGAYAILAIPIVTAILVTGPTVVGLCVAVASLAGFLAHEPLLVALGHRGARAQRTTPAAQRRLTVLLTVTIAGGVNAVVVGSTSVRYSLVLCCTLAIACFVLAIAGKHRTLG
ncbi:MAG: YwiC-like family protein, partial [Planctomycetales bacterium]|nr:YwiC-like family protein [Planctomycetales bacterium]